MCLDVNRCNVSSFASRGIILSHDEHGCHVNSQCHTCVSDRISLQHESEANSLGFRSEKWEEGQIILAATYNKNQQQHAAINNAEL